LWFGALDGLVWVFVQVGAAVWAWPHESVGLLVVVELLSDLRHQLVQLAFDGWDVGVVVG
jgi:hypothetical protein